MTSLERTSTDATSVLPPEVITCLRNARFLHLATCANNIPHVSLMNYTYLPTTPYSSSPTIIMTTPPSSRKTENLESNSRVSLLVHDWISHRPPTLSQTGSSSQSSRPAPRSGSLAELLLGMNTASLGRISTTINGVAKIIAPGSEQENWYKAQHLANNTFVPNEDPDASEALTNGGLWGGGGIEPNSTSRDERNESTGTKWNADGEDVKVVVVHIQDGRIADWKGQVRDWHV